MNHLVPDPEIEQFLDEIRSRLRGAPKADLDEILLELRGHISERLAEGHDVAEAIESLGDPADLAREYRVGRAASQAECGSPIVVLHSLLLLRRGFWGWATLALAALGYAWAFALAGAALEKLIAPRDVGLWYGPGNAFFPRLMVDGPGPPGARELLGWWFVPAGLAACAVLLALTKRFARWRIRRAGASLQPRM